MNWLLLLHQIPPKPAYFRAKVLRRLAQFGALPIKNSAYLLPDIEDTREDFEWICREIKAEGGAAWLFRAEALVGFSVEEIQAAFRHLRDTDYEELIASAPELDEGKILLRLAELAKIDFFDHPARTRVEAILADRKRRAQQNPPSSAAAKTQATWVTRRGMKVDRIGSAWLIQRFLDPQARFRFVEPSTYRHSEGELRFDMFEGEFTHEGDLCTFEVLLARYRLDVQHPALIPIAEMIHDIDLKEDRYQRPETVGLARLLAGVCAALPEDESRLTQGSAIFDFFYQSFLV